MPAANASSERSVSSFKARKDTSPFNNWRRKVEPPHDAYVHRDRTAANQFVSKQEIGDIYPKWFARKLCLVSHPNETKQENEIVPGVYAPYFLNYLNLTRGSGVNWPITRVCLSDT